MSDRLVLMGAILGAHGIKGGVKVKSFTGQPAAIADYGPLLDPKRKRSFDLKVTGQGDAAKGIVIARIEGVADPGQRHVDDVAQFALRVVGDPDGHHVGITGGLDVFVLGRVAELFGNVRHGLPLWDGVLCADEDRRARP